MTMKEAMDEIKIAVENAGMNYCEYLNKAIDTLDNLPTPIGYIESGKSYVVKVNTNDEVVDQRTLESISKYVEEKDSRVLFISDNFEFVNPDGQ